MGKEEQNSNTPKKGWFSKVGNLIFEDTSEKEKTEETSTEEKESPNGDPTKIGKVSYSDLSQIPGIPASMAMPTTNGMFDEKFYNSFLKIIEDNNVAGMDYFEFSRAKKNLEAAGTPPPSSYQTAFIALQSSAPSLNKDVLINTADFYIGKLAEEEKEFGLEMQQKVENEVNSRIAQAKSKQDTISSKQEEIIRLQLEINGLQTEISTLNSEAQQSQFKIDSIAKNFKVSLEVLLKQIEADKDNIKTFIK